MFGIINNTIFLIIKLYAYELNKTINQIEELYLTLRLKDKITVFMGGASELATAAASRFLEEGAKLALIDLDENAFNRVRNKYVDQNNKVQMFTADVRTMSM